MGEQVENKKNILTEAEDAEEQENQNSLPKKKPRKKLFISIAVFLLIILASGTIYYFYGEKVFATIKEQKPESINQVVSLEPFVVNLMDSYSPLKYLKIVIQIETDNPELTQAKIPNIRDAIIFVLTQKTPEELLTQEGKLALKDEIKEATNKTVGKNIIRNVYCAEFVMQ